MKVYPGKTDCNPEDVKYNPMTLERIDSHFQDLINKGTIQAAGYLLSRHGKVFAFRTMGKRSVTEDKGDFTPDTIRPIASISKVITTTAILQLIEQGKIYLNQPVSTIIEEFGTQMHRHINIFQLLTHTSGLKGDPGSFFEPYPDYSFESWTKDNWIKKALSGPLQFKPGTVWAYCSKGFAFLAEIVARISGMDFDDYIINNIFKPLGMENSFFFIPDAERERVSLTSSEWNKERVNRKKEDMITLSFLGGGGIFSTLHDLWKFGQMTMNGGTFAGICILGRKTIEAAVKPQVKDIIAFSWREHIFDDNYKWTCGLGWEVNKHSFLSDGTYDHEGAEGAGIFIDPGEDFIFVGFYPDVEWHPESWVSPLAIAWSGIQ